VGKRHEWAKRQATKAGTGFTELANGLPPVKTLAACRPSATGWGPNEMLAFFERWRAVIPTPLSEAGRAGGYWWELSMRQVEVSRTIVFDAPRRGRAFFEAVVADSVDLGRPDAVPPPPSIVSIVAPPGR